MGLEVLDLAFRAPGRGVGWLDLISAPDADPILLGGSVATTDGEVRTDFTIEASQESLNGTQAQLAQQSDTEFAILNEDGETPSGYGITAYSEVSLIGDSWQLHSGTLTDPDGLAIDFFAATDPLPAVAVVTITIAAIGMAGCLISIGIDVLSGDCRQALAPQIQACASSGGKPNVTVRTIYGFSNAGGSFRIGCNRECTLECQS